MIKNYRTLFIIIALVAIVGVGLHIRSYYISRDGKYLLGFDPYYHYRMAGTILEGGSRPEWDTIAAYPTGAPVRHPPLFHYYLAYSYKVVSLFSGMTLLQWCIYANTIPVILTILVAYLAGKAVTNWVGGLFTALFMAVNGAISSRTVIGHTDTDIWIILFSFAATYFMASILKNEKKYTWSALLGFSLFLFALTWVGYWYLCFLVFSVFGICILVDGLKKKFDERLLSAFALSFLFFSVPWTLYKGYYMTGAIFIVLGVLWGFGHKFLAQKIKKFPIPTSLAIIILGVYMFYGEGILSAGMKAGGRLLGIVSQPEGTMILPDISISILQRNVVTLSAMLQLFSVLLLVAPFGIAVLIWKRSQFSFQFLLYLALYFAGTVLTLRMGGRYTMLFAIPLVLASGAFFGVLPEMVEGKVTSKGIAAIVLACSLSVVPCYVKGWQVSKASAAMSDDTFEMLTWINENLPEDAIIIAGWDTGYWIESVGKRRSVMNGAHYDILWRVVKYGKIVETQDETIAMKEVYGFDSRSEVENLRQFPEGSDSLIEMEMRKFAEDNAYLLVTEWTMLTFYWLSYFGNWNYVTGEGEGRIYNPMWAEDAQKLIAGTEYIYGDESITFAVIEENDRYHSYILDESGEYPTMGTLFLKDGTMHFLKREGGSLGLIYIPPGSMPYFQTALIWPDMPSEVFFISERDIGSMMTKLYFFNGEGLHYFELIKELRTARLYKVHKVPQEFDQGVVTEIDTYGIA